MDQQAMFPQAPVQETDAGDWRESVRAPLPITGRFVRSSVSGDEYDTGVKAPGPEFWIALLSAQKAARVLGHDESVEKKGGGDMYTYASAEAILEESRRILHDNNLLVIQSMTIGSTDRTKRRSVAHAAFVVVHAPTGQGLVIPFEAAVHATEKFQPPKAVNAATTVSLRWFLRGLLMIRVSDEPDPEGGKAVQPQAYVQQPEWPPAGHYWDQQWQRWLPIPQQPAPQWVPQPAAPQPQQQWVPPTPQAQAALYADPTVQAAGAMFQAQQVSAPAQPAGLSQGASFQQPSPMLPQGATTQPQHDQANGTRGPARQIEEPVEPTEPDQWVIALTRAGVQNSVAEEFAMAAFDRVITEGLRDVLRREIEARMGTHEAALEASRALWAGTGYVPQPQLPPDQRTLPTGRQCLRYLLKLSKHNQKQPTA